MRISLALVLAIALFSSSCNKTSFATFNTYLNRKAEGELIKELKEGGMTSNPTVQIASVAEIIQRTEPDILLLQEFDYDSAGMAIALFQKNYLEKTWFGSTAIAYPHVFIAPSNTGVDSGQDLNNNGKTGEPADAFGFGFYEGQYGMVLLSKYPILHDKVRTFQRFLWKDMPDAKMPADYYSEEAIEVLRLSSKSHWDIPIRIKDKVVHVLASHPTPPVFDGPEDRNGKRNHDEIRFWKDYIDGASYIYDDEGQTGGLEVGARFVIMGDMNADPNDGDSSGNPMDLLLHHQGVNSSKIPQSQGGKYMSEKQGYSNNDHKTDPKYDTADFKDDPGPGNLRLDYVLPSRNLKIRKASVYWPVPGDLGYQLVGPGQEIISSDHRQVKVVVSVQ